ncbi:hypothetical protein [Nonomuraea sp. NPDC052265]|uniref:hypothetical protein n=1 Tax=Nonomuraea sp. NPDC052265 TaxID=3364374 RepID=UPI0037C8A318
MTYRYRSEYAEMLRAEGRAAAMARTMAEAMTRTRADKVLWLLDRRGVDVPDDVRERVTSCTDITLIETWFDRAVNADSLSDVFEDDSPVRPEAG